MPAALVWLSAFTLYIRTACPTLAAGDTAELFLAGHDLDVTHPPGYPVAAWVLGAALPRGARPLPAWFAAAVALAHHSIAVFLAPVAAVPLWRHRATLTARTLLVGVALGVLPLSVKAVYPALRSPALRA